MATSVATRTGDDGSVEWETTRFTRAKLACDGFKVLDTVTISCVYHPPKDDTPAWYELTHVYVPATACPELLTPARDALLSAADARFEPAPDEARAGSRKLKKKKLSDSKGIRGEITDVAKPKGRGSKSQGGRMCMYGAHSRRASGPSDKVSDKAEKWPDHYNPSGARADVDDGTVRPRRVGVRFVLRRRVRGECVESAWKVIKAMRWILCMDFFSIE